MFAMMHVPLTVGSMLEHAENFFPKKEVISQTHDKLHRLTYKEIGQRTRRLMSVLEELGAQKGDRIGTLAWNHHRHLELYFAAPGKIGRASCRERVMLLKVRLGWRV